MDLDREDLLTILRGDSLLPIYTIKDDAGPTIIDLKTADELPGFSEGNFMTDAEFDATFSETSRLVIDSFDANGTTYRRGQSVELRSGDFMRIVDILQHKRNQAIFIRGPRFRRMSRFPGLFDQHLKRATPEHSQAEGNYTYKRSLPSIFFQREQTKQVPLKSRGQRTMPISISRDSRHKRSATGAKRAFYRKKRAFEKGRQPANTRIGTKRIHLDRVRGGNTKYRALCKALPDFPDPTHGPGRLPLATVNDAIARIPQGFANHEVEGAAKRNGAPYDADLPLRNCITTGGSLNIHPSGKRCFTDRELACLQSFALDHVFGKMGVKKQIGNAVPPLVALVFFGHIRRRLEEADR